MAEDGADAQEQQNADAQQRPPPVRLFTIRNRGYRKCSHMTDVIFMMPSGLLLLAQLPSDEPSELGKTFRVALGQHVNQRRGDRVGVE